MNGFRFQASEEAAAQAVLGLAAGFLGGITDTVLARLIDVVLSVPFLLVAIAIYIRLQLQETPIFQEIRAKGQMTRNPWREAFLGPNMKFVLIADQ